MNFGQKVIYSIGVFVVMNITGTLLVSAAKEIEKTLKKRSNKGEA